MATTDDIARLTAVLVRQAQQNGEAAALRRTSGLEASAIGKACGVSAGQVMAWEAGYAQPTTSEGIAWLSILWNSQKSNAVRWNGDRPVTETPGA